jgi:hypothetical protein
MIVISDLSSCPRRESNPDLRFRKPRCYLGRRFLLPIGCQILFNNRAGDCYIFRMVGALVLRSLGPTRGGFHEFKPMERPSVHLFLSAQIEIGDVCLELYLLDQSIQLAMLAGFDKATYCALVAREFEASIDAEAQYREDCSSYNRGLGV